MDRWLDGLISEKQKAIERYERMPEIAKIRATHEELIRVYRHLHVESHLLALARQVIDGHPDIPFASLERVVKLMASKEICQPLDRRVFSSGALWTKPLQEDLVLPLPEDGACPFGYFFESIQWDLTLGILKQSIHSRTCYGIRTRLTPTGLEVNGEIVSDGDVAVFQRALVKGFQSPFTWEIVPLPG